MLKRPNHRLAIDLLKQNLQKEAHIIDHSKWTVRKMSISKCFYQTLVTNVPSTNKLLAVRQPHLNHAISQKYSDVQSSPASQPSNELISAIRTHESDPCNHDERHLGRIYTIPKKDAKALGATKQRSPHCLVPLKFLELQELFGEHSFLIRKPALEVISYLNQVKGLETNQQVNNIRFILWGEHGNGKSASLAHIKHYCYNDGRIILDFNKIKLWFTHHKELAVSEWNPNRFDHVGQSVKFLQDFTSNNEGKFDNLKTHKKYKWSEKESTEEGSPLSDIVRQGVARPKFSADCLCVLMKELQLHSEEGNCKMVLLVDGVNVLFERRTNINRKLPTKRVKGPFKAQWTEESIAPDEFSVIRSIKKILKGNFPNSVAVVSVDKADALEPAPYYPGFMTWKTRGSNRWWDTRKRIMVPQIKPNYPFSLLGEEGWEYCEPFIPIEVDSYSKSEMDTMIDFYLEKRYISDNASTPAGRAELHFMTGRSPLDLMDYSSWW